MRCFKSSCNGNSHRYYNATYIYIYIYITQPEIVQLRDLLKLLLKFYLLILKIGEYLFNKMILIINIPHLN